MLRLRTRHIAQVKIIDEISRLGRENQKQFLKYFTHLLEQALKLQVMQGAAVDGVLQSLSENEQAFAQRLNKVPALEQQQAIIEELDKAAYYIERNANAKILFHALTIRLQHIIVQRCSTSRLNGADWYKKIYICELSYFRQRILMRFWLVKKI